MCSGSDEQHKKRATVETGKEGEPHRDQDPLVESRPVAPAAMGRPRPGQRLARLQRYHHSSNNVSRRHFSSTYTSPPCSGTRNSLGMHAGMLSASEANPADHEASPRYRHLPILPFGAWQDSGLHAVVTIQLDRYPKWEPTNRVYTSVERKTAPFRVPALQTPSRCRLEQTSTVRRLPARPAGTAPGGPSGLSITPSYQ